MAAETPAMARGLERDLRGDFWRLESWGLGFCEEEEKEDEERSHLKEAAHGVAVARGLRRPEREVEEESGALLSRLVDAAKEDIALRRR